MDRLREECPVALAVSLHAPNDALRDRLEAHLARRGHGEDAAERQLLLRVGERPGQTERRVGEEQRAVAAIDEIVWRVEAFAVEAIRKLSSRDAARWPEFVAFMNAAAGWIVDATCRDRSYGARPLRRALQRHVEDPLSEALIQGSLGNAHLIEVFVDGAALNFRPLDGDAMRAAAARLVGELFEDLRALQVLEREHLRRNRAQHRGRAALLHEGVDAEAREVRHREGKVALEVFLVELALPVVHDVVDHPVHVLVLERRYVDLAHVAVHADHRRQPRRQVQVGSLVLDDKGKQFSEIHYNSPGSGRVKVCGQSTTTCKPCASASAAPKRTSVSAKARSVCIGT